MLGYGRLEWSGGGGGEAQEREFVGTNVKVSENENEDDEGQYAGAYLASATDSLQAFESLDKKLNNLSLPEPKVKLLKSVKKEPPKKIILGSIVLGEDMKSDILNDFYQSTTMKITDPLPLNPSNTTGNSLRILKFHKYLPSIHRRERAPVTLMFLPLIEGENQVNLILQADNLYKVGYEINGHCYLLFFDHPEDSEAVFNGLYKLGYKDEQIFDVEVRYPALEALANKNRGELMLGRANLLKYFRLLLSPDLHKYVFLVSEIVLFFTQIICEALRIHDMRVHILQNFSDDKGSLGVPTPQHLVIMQYGWGIASNRLQREAMGLPGFEVKVDNDGEVIDVPNLYLINQPK